MVLEKSELVSYIFDLADIEIREYTMKQILYKLKEDQEKDVRRLNAELEKMQNFLCTSKAQYQQKRQKRDQMSYEINKQKTLDEIKLMMPSKAMEEYEQLKDKQIFYSLTPQEQKRYNQLNSAMEKYHNAVSKKEKILFEYESLQQYITNYEIDISNREKELEILLSKEASMKIAHKFMAKQICQMENQIATIQSKKNILYNLNVIPIDYRTIDCIMILKSIFKNDLADTIREAILLYEEKLFRGEVIKGIDKIYDMLGSLAYSMQSIESELIQIKHGIYSMEKELMDISNSIYDIAGEISKQTTSIGDLQNQFHQNSNEQAYFRHQILEEAKATRYAIDSVRFSTEKANSYLRYYNL